MFGAQRSRARVSINKSIKTESIQPTFDINDGKLHKYDKHFVACKAKSLEAIATVLHHNSTDFHSPYLSHSLTLFISHFLCVLFEMRSHTHFRLLCCVMVKGMNRLKPHRTTINEVKQKLCNETVIKTGVTNSTQISHSERKLFNSYCGFSVLYGKTLFPLYARCATFMMTCDYTEIFDLKCATIVVIDFRRLCHSLNT